jgi:uncharacterized protein (TIGR00730 family)
LAAVCVFCASSRRIEPRYLDLATSVGHELARRGHSLVSGGGKVSMMGAVAAAARAGGAHTVGVMPMVLRDREIADKASDELVITADMRQRKAVMEARSDAFLGLPGGIGTLEEVFEIWTSRSLDLHLKPVILLDPEGFYDGLLGWLRGLVDTGFVRAEALAMLTVAPSVGAAFDLLEAGIERPAAETATSGPDLTGERSGPPGLLG